MANFEDIVRESVRKNREAQNNRLNVPKNPIRLGRNHWRWVVTPLAAALGIVAGMSIRFVSSNVNNTLALVRDTIEVTKVQRDTIYLTKVEKESILRHDTIYINTSSRSKTAQATPSQILDKEPLCTSIQCDGINYSLLVVN